MLAAPTPPKEERAGATSTTSASPVTTSQEAADLAAGDPHGATHFDRVDRPVGYSAADTRGGEYERRCDLSNMERLWLPNGDRHDQTILPSSACVVSDNEKVYSPLGEDRVSHRVRVRVVDQVPHARAQRTPPPAEPASTSATAEPASPTRNTHWGRPTPADAEALRGVPVVGPGGGAIRGTQPGANLR